MLYFILVQSLLVNDPDVQIDGKEAALALIGGNVFLSSENIYVSGSSVHSKQQFFLAQSHGGVIPALLRISGFLEL